LPPALRLNYDVLSIIFVISLAEWETAALTLSSVCRLWRYIALSTPQIWSRIDLDPPNNPSILRLFLERSKPRPLHILIPSCASDTQLELLSSATDRILCMKITNNFRFLQRQFPALERLELHLNSHCYIFQSCRFPQLRELSLASDYTATRLRISAEQTGFTGLQKLKILNEATTQWSKIVQSASSTLVSLTLDAVHPSNPQTCRFFFPQLRHLRVTKTGWGIRLLLDLDAPILESIEEGFGVGIIDGVSIRLRDPSSVKQVLVESLAARLTPYPALRELWIDCRKYYDGLTKNETLDSLGHQINSCPDLDAVFYCGGSQRRALWIGEHIPPGSIFTVISDLVQETGRDIAVREFLPTRLDLPGSMRRSVSILPTVIDFLVVTDQNVERVLWIAVSSGIVCSPPSDAVIEMYLCHVSSLLD
jgi:F-box-like